MMTRKCKHVNTRVENVDDENQVVICDDCGTKLLDLHIEPPTRKEFDDLYETHLGFFYNVCDALDVDFLTASLDDVLEKIKQLNSK